MSESMIERVARALYEDWLTWPEVATEAAMNGPHPTWENLVFARFQWFHRAGVAIAAMREPTDAMVRAGQNCQAGTYEEDIPRIFTAMIDAALNEQVSA